MKTPVNWDAVLNKCAEYINTIEETGKPPKDGDVYIFEAAITATYGNEAWPWIHEMGDIYYEKHQVE